MIVSFNLRGRAMRFRIQSKGDFTFLQVALLHSLLNGKVFMEWVGPAVLKAYQWQVSRPVQFAYQ
jgi:hypothetical protein